MSKKWRDWDANHGNEDWMLRKSERTIKKKRVPKKPDPELLAINAETACP